MREIHEQLALVAQEAARLAHGVDPTKLEDPTPCPEYDVRTMTAHLMQEIVLHGWDLAVATGQQPRFPDDVVATVLRELDRSEDTDNDEWYKAPVPTASTATLLDQAVARSGRDPSLGHPPPARDG